jgi:hypothetical protein
MKTIWEKGDIVVGSYVCKPRTDGSLKIHSGRAKWTKKICYRFKSHADDKRYTLVSITDGMIEDFYTEKELLAHLNNNGLIPMPLQWLIDTIVYLEDEFTIPK